MTIDSAVAIKTPSLPQAALVGAKANEHYLSCRIWDLKSASAHAGAHGFRPAELGELEATHRFCEDLMQMQLAPLWALASAHGHTHGTAWIHREPEVLTRITGVWLILPLSWDGEASLRSGRFGYKTPRLDELCEPGQEISAVYLWFAGGTSKAARRAIMRTTDTWLKGPMSGLRIYGRAASLAGAEAMAGFGFRRLAPERQDLFILGEQRSEGR